MDTEKRHQLKTNELAEALAKLRNFWNDPQTVYWLIGLAVLVLAYGGYRLYTHTRARQITSAWRDLSQAGMNAPDFAGAVAELQALVQKNSNHAVTASGRLRLAAVLRQQAEADPVRREELLRESIANLQAVADDPTSPTALVAAAIFSLGTSYESLREFDRARTAYEMLADQRFAGLPFQSRAVERLATLGELPASSPFLPGAPPSPEPLAASQPPETAATQPAEGQPAATPPAAAPEAVDETSQPISETDSPAEPPDPPEPRSPGADSP